MNKLLISSQCSNIYFDLQNDHWSLFHMKQKTGKIVPHGAMLLFTNCLQMKYKKHMTYLNRYGIIYT